MQKHEPDISRRPLDLLTRLGGIAVIGLLLVQILVVAFRYVFSIGSPWATDLLIYLNFLIVTVPMIWVVASNKGVRVDVLRGRFSARTQNLCDRIALLFLFCPAMIWAAWTSWPLTRNSWSLLESSPNMGGLPGYFILKSILTLVFTGLALTAVWIGLRPRLYDEAAKDG